MTRFPNGLSSFGIPVLPSMLMGVFGRYWFVDAKTGSDGFSGRQPDKPFLTMAKAFANIDSGDVICFRGKVREQLVSPVGVFDITVIGAGNRPRHADDHSESSNPGRGSSGATWMAPASGGVAAQATVRVIQQGWRFQNFLFAAIDSDAAMIEIVRDAGAGDDERDASHTHALGLKFAGAGVGIRSGVAGSFTEIPNHVVVEGSVFIDNTYAIRGAIQGQRWSIKWNEFQANTNHITAPLGASFIQHNIFGAFTAAANSGGIDLTGGQGLNIVTKNYLSGTYSNAGGYVAANANDEWAGNWNTLSGGITVANPG